MGSFELRRRIEGFGLFALVLLLGLLLSFGAMAILGAPGEVFVVLSIIIGGIMILTFVDHMISYRFPSRSIFDTSRRKLSKELGLWFYMVGLTVLAVVFVLRPITEEGKPLIDAIHLYGGTIGGALFLSGLCLAVYAWRLREGAISGIIGLGGGTFTPKQVMDLKNGICPRCGKKMTPSKMDFDNTERWFCSNCYEFFVIRPSG